MTPKTKDIAHLPQEEVSIEVPSTEASAELHGMVEKKIKNLTGKWREEKERYQAHVESGGYRPTGYVYWDCLLLGPYQKSSFPYSSPSKIIAANEPALMVGLIWINQVMGPSNTVSGSILFGGKDYTAVFEANNISKLTKFMSYHTSDQLDSPAPEFTELYWEFTAPEPADQNVPELFEVHFAVDLNLKGQPFAAFATWHWDPDSGNFFPGWTPQTPPVGYGIPSTPPAWWPTWPHFDHDIPARFLVYHLG